MQKRFDRLRHATPGWSTRRVLRVLGNASDAEDVAQECFETLARLSKAPESHLGAWLHRVAVNRAIDRVRADSRRKGREAQFVVECETTIEPEWDDIYGHVDEAIAELSEKFRAAVVAHFLENQSRADVVRAMDISPRTVAYRVKRGVELICKSLNLKPAVERGAEAQLIQPSGLTQKPQLTHRVSLHFCASKAVALCIHAQPPDLG